MANKWNDGRAVEQNQYAKGHPCTATPAAPHDPAFCSTQSAYVGVWFVSGRFVLDASMPHACVFPWFLLFAPLPP